MKRIHARPMSRRHLQQEPDGIRTVILILIVTGWILAAMIHLSKR